MTHQIALPPDQERKLNQQAHLRGLAAEDYLRQIVAAWLDGVPLNTQGDVLGVDTVDNWLDGLATEGDNLPTLNPNALTRERLHAEHD